MSTHFVRHSRALLLLSAVPGVWGCNQPAGGPASGELGSTATIDRMLKAYEDLASRRFQVLADFETPAQATLFRREPTGSRGLELTTSQSRRETGVGSLKMTFTDSTQRVVATDTPEAEWSLFRDWTPYHLLMLSVFSPRPLGGFRFSARSGTDVPLTYEHPRTALEPGWNLVRIDLGLLSDQVNLADVRELRFWCEPLESPVDLYLDDLILVNNASQIFGPAQPAPGELYVRSEGRRLVIGSAERFELVFSEGAIRQWFDLSGDPLRTRSLTGGQPLGPVPVAAPHSVDAVGFPERVLSAAQPALGLQAVQELVEATPLRVVVRGEWRKRGEEEAAQATDPARRWLYSVYHDGRVYVECSGSNEDLEGATATAMAFCCDAESGFKADMVPVASESAGPGDRDPYVLFSRAERGRADLLIVPYGRVSGALIHQPGDPRLCAVWRLPEGETRFSFACLLRVWPAEIDGPAQALAMVGDYRHPLPMLVNTGSLAKSDPGDLDRDGFSESRGHYALQLDGSAAKVNVTGRRYLRFSPVFRLNNVAQRDVWVYVDGRQIPVYREREGDAIFEVPGMISNEVLVEVTSREKGLR